MRHLKEMSINYEVLSIYNTYLINKITYVIKLPNFYPYVTIK